MYQQLHVNLLFSINCLTKFLGLVVLFFVMLMVFYYLGSWLLVLLSVTINLYLNK